MARRLFALVRLLIGLVVLPASGYAQEPSNPTVDSPGFRQNSEYFAQMPFENIDTSSGGLILTFTDLVLPGNAGRELRFQHTYNSKGNTGWTFGIAGIPLWIHNPAYPPPESTPGFQEMTPSLHMADGGVRKLAWYGQPFGTVSISSDFLKFNRTGQLRRLELPNGDHCDYTAFASNAVKLASCTDVFGNLTTFDWDTDINPHELRVTQHVGADERLITVVIDSPTAFPTEMRFGDRTWTFDHDPQTQTLSSVTPPAGPPWTFSYNSGVRPGLVSAIGTPHGGSIEFTYDNQAYAMANPQTTEYTLVVTQRTVFDRGHAKLGSWQYEYVIGPGGNSGLTTVTTRDADDEPISRTTSEHGWNDDPESVFDGPAGLVPLVARTVEKPNGANWIVLEREERTYTMVKIPPLNVGTLELASRKIIRKDGGADTNYLTELTYSDTNLGDYHRPKQIVETPPTGAAEKRTTTIEYDQSLATNKNILGLPTTEKVKIGTEEFVKSWTYDSTNGFRKSETIYGIETKFGSDGNGNVAWIEKANGKSTLFEYKYGRPKAIITPLHSITREINSDGSIDSETQAGRTTQFDYDDLGRLTSIMPPGSSNPTEIEYDNLGGETVTTTRGPSQIIASLDGFGRQTQVANSVGVKTKTTYDADGRVVKEGYPFTGNAETEDRWTEIEYDALGRVTKRKNPDTPTRSESLRTYGANGLVTLKDEIGRETQQTWKGFGSPDDAQLAKVVDAKGSVWTYNYNTLGKLRTVSLDGTVLRQWTYDDTTGLLKTETHPESGTTQYFYEDVDGSAGLLTSTTDAKGKTTSYEYDLNDRIKRISADGRPTLITYEEGSDNRASALNGSDAVTWRYDSAGRLEARQDSIDGKSFSTLYEYDDNDNVDTIHYPSGRRIEFEFDAESRPIRIFEATRNYATSILHHPSGGVASYTAGNGVNTTIAYETNRYWTTSISSGSLQIGYSGHDYTGNPANVSTTSPGVTFNLALEYDELDRLKKVVGPQGTTTYGYDAHGNRNDGTYNTATLRLMNHAGTAFSYDDNGNALSIGTANFTYTPQNQVETAATPGFNVTYAYDADNQRVKKVSAGSSTYYLRGANANLLTEWKDPGTSNGHIRDYIYLGSRLLSAVDRDSPLDPAGLSVPVTASHRWASSYQVPDSSGDTVTLSGGISAAARKSTHPEMPRTGLRLGVEEASLDFMRTGPVFTGNNTEQPKQGSIFLEFAIERYPYSDTAEILRVNSGDLKLYITSAGELILKNDGGRPTPITIWTSAPVEKNQPHTLELRFEFNSTTSFQPPNPEWEGLTSWVQVIFDGALAESYGASPGGVWSSSETNLYGLDNRITGSYWSNTELRSPGAENGLLMNIFRSGLTAAKNHGDALGSYGSSWRTTLLQPDGAGTYSQWPNGQPDWRARSAVIGGTGFTNHVSPTTVGQKVSYRIESMLSHGITGNIGAVLVGVRMASGTSLTKAFIRRNGVETVLTDLMLNSTDFRWYRVAQSGWSPTDVIEVGVTANALTNALNSVALLVEHNTPEPEPLTARSVRVVTRPYTGNGGAQTIDFGIDQVPTVMFVMPQAGAPTNTEPVWWWDSRIAAGLMTQSTVDFNRIWPQRGKFHVIHTSPKSFNANGVNYVAIAVFDPSGRYVIPFAINKGSELTDDDYTHQLRKPATGQLADQFTPDFVFGGATFGVTSSASHAAVYRGPGHAGDLTSKLGVSSAVGPDADRIQALGAGTVQFGNGFDGDAGDMAFWAGRVNDGVSTERLMAVTSYVGNGAASRNISLALNGGSPVLVFVVPTNSEKKVFRVNTDTTGRQTSTGGAVANSITALGTNQITVGSALNVNGTTYDVWAIKTGQVKP